MMIGYALVTVAVVLAMLAPQVARAAWSDDAMPAGLFDPPKHCGNAHASRSKMTDEEIRNVRELAEREFEQDKERRNARSGRLRSVSGTSIGDSKYAWTLRTRPGTRRSARCR
jgi:hypothetical protein